MPLIEPGKRAPNFTLQDQHGEKHRLDNLRGRVVVLYFYPKDDTPDCTIQACLFRDHHPDFSKVDATILGVSPDGIQSHDAFDKHHQLGFPLLADTAKNADGNPAVCALYGAWREKVLYGRRYNGVVRTTYLIDPAGIVRQRWDRVKVTGHAGEVLAAVKMLRGSEAAPSKKRASVRKSSSRAKAEDVKKKPNRTVKKRIGAASKVRGKSVPPSRLGAGSRR